jgi:hypothetical protein
MASGRQALKYTQTKADQYAVGDSPRIKVLSKSTVEKSGGVGS